MRLLKGDALGIASPAGSFDKKKFKEGIRVLKSMGFRIIIPDGLYKKKGYLAGDDRLRAKQLNRLFADPDVKGIVCAKGGFGSIRILSLLDYELIGKNPKVFAGFSDVSALLWALYMKTGLATFHAPNVTTLADASGKTVESMLSAISSGSVLEIKAEKGVEIMPGSAKGPLTGGNLTTLCHLAGTPFAPDFDGHILFLEDTGEAPYKIDRALSQMKLAGFFQKISGLVLGSFEGCGPEKSIYKIVHEIFREYEIPVLGGFKAGHGKDNMTLSFGLEVIFDTCEKKLFSKEPATAGATIL